MVDDTSTIADIQHDLSFTLQNYMLSDNFPAHRPRVTFHVSQISINILYESYPELQIKPKVLAQNSTTLSHSGTL